MEMHGGQQRRRPHTRQSGGRAPAPVPSEATTAPTQQHSGPQTRLQAAIIISQGRLPVISAPQRAVAVASRSSRSQPQQQQPLMQTEAARPGAKRTRAAAASVIAADVSPGSAQPQQQRPLTRSQAARAAKRSREALDDTPASSQCQQQQQQQQPHPEEPTPKTAASVLQLAQMLDALPGASTQHLPTVLEAMVSERMDSELHGVIVSALAEVAFAAPTELLQAMAAQPASLHHMLRVLQVSPSGSKLLRAATAVLSAVSREAAVSGPAAAADVTDVIAHHPQSLQRLLTSMASSSGGSSGDSSGGGNCVAHAAASVVGLAATTQLHPGPESTAVTEKWFDLLCQQPQGLHLLLQSLHSVMRITAGAAALALMAFAEALPARLLGEVMSPQQRRGLQFLLSALDSSNRAVLVLTAAVLERLLTAANQQQLAVLLRHLLRAVQRNSQDAGQLVFGMSLSPAGLQVLMQHVKLLLPLLLLRSPGTFQRFAFNIIGRLALVPDGVEALQLAGVTQLRSMLQAMVQHGSLEGQFAAGLVCGVVASTAEGLSAFTELVPQLLEASQTQHLPGITSQAMMIVLALVTRGGTAGCAAVLRHAGGVLAALLQLQQQQQEHSDAVRDAGSTVLALLDTAQGRELLSQEQHLDTLLLTMQQRGLAAWYAAKAVAIIAAAVPASRAVLLAPERQAVIHGVAAVLPDIQAFAEATPEFCQAFGPVFHMTVAAAACGLVPSYVGMLVSIMLDRPGLTFAMYDVLIQLVTFELGLLALAPHIADISNALRDRIDEDDYQIRSPEGLLDSHADICIKVRQTVRRLQAAQQQAEVRMHHAGLQLAAAHARYRRRPRTKKLQAGVMLWLQAMGVMAAKNEQLKQQLERAACTACKKIACVQCVDWLC